MFGDELGNLVKEENELNKLFNDAAYQKNEQISLQRINLLNLNGLPLPFDCQIKVQREIIVDLFLIDHSHRIKIIRETFTQASQPVTKVKFADFFFQDSWQIKKVSITMAQTFRTLLGYRYCTERLYSNMVKSSAYFRPSHFKSKRHLVKSTFHYRDPGLVSFWCYTRTSSQ